MINKSRNLVKEKGIYSEPDAYSGHPIDENMEKIVMEYYLNDDYNCSKQSPNKYDVFTIKVNNKKDKEVKRFLTRGLKETYKVFKNVSQNISSLAPSKKFVSVSIVQIMIYFLRA